MANKGTFKKGDPRAGRKPGSVNKATADVRRSFAMLLEGAAPKLDKWLNRVAVDDPARALTIVKDLAEYHIPKLARTEVTGPQGGPIEITRVYYSKKPDAENHNP